MLKKSQAKFLEKCKYNFKYLCPSCHRSSVGVHGRNGRKLDLKFKLELQNTFEVLLDKQYFTKEELKSILEINENSVNGLCKLTKQEKGVFNRENILVTLMGGKKVTDEEVKELNE